MTASAFLAKISKEQFIVFKCFLVDWITFIVFGLLIIVGQFLDPFQRPIPLNDSSISNPHKPDTFPNWTVPVISILLPGFLITIYCCFIKPTLKLYIQPVLIGLLLSVGTAAFLTEYVKLYIGRLRPDFMDRCQPDPAQLAQGIVACTGSAYEIREGRISFPSGHTSNVFAGLLYFGLFIAGQIGLFSQGITTNGTYSALNQCPSSTGADQPINAVVIDLESQQQQQARASTPSSSSCSDDHALSSVYECRKEDRFRTLKVIAFLSPLIFALFVGFSRIVDNRHHWTDVFAGATLGIFVAIISYLQYFKWITSSSASLPRRQPNNNTNANATSSNEYSQLLHRPK